MINFWRRVFRDGSRLSHDSQDPKPFRTKYTIVYLYNSQKRQLLKMNLKISLRDQNVVHILFAPFHYEKLQVTFTKTNCFGCLFICVYLIQVAVFLSFLVWSIDYAIQHKTKSKNKTDRVTLSGEKKKTAQSSEWNFSLSHLNEMIWVLQSIFVQWHPAAIRSYFRYIIYTEDRKIARLAWSPGDTRFTGLDLLLNW